MEQDVLVRPKSIGFFCFGAELLLPADNPDLLKRRGLVF
jgi:hypothetical protein